MRSRDLLFFVAAGFGLLFLLQQEGSITFVKGFWQPHDSTLQRRATQYLNTKTTKHQKNTQLDNHELIDIRNQNYGYQQYSAEIAKPLFSDVDGDGFNEIILSDRTGSKITILDTKTTKKHLNSLDTFLSLPIRKSTIQKSKNPSPLYQAEEITIVGLGAGKIDKHSRREIIIAVFSDWRVVAFDHELKELWETRISSSQTPEQLKRIGAPSQVNIKIIPQRIHSKDAGIVVIGLRMYHTRQHEHIRFNHRGKMQETDPYEKPSHYSFFAFEGKSGAQRWRHEATDYHFVPEEEQLFPQHNFKLRIQQHEEHSGEVNWKNYQKDVLRHFRMHRIRHPFDVTLDIDFFQSSSKKRKTKKTPSQYGSFGSALTSFFKRFNPKKKMKRASRTPNVIVAHLEQNLEIIHLYTGRTICQVLPLRQEVTYTDFSGDGVIDSAQAIVQPRSVAHKEGQCYALFESGTGSVDQPEVLFTTPICTPQKSFSSFSISSLIKQESELTENTKAVPPAIIETYAGFGTKQTKRDAIFLVSTGLVTSVAFQTNVKSGGIVKLLKNAFSSENKENGEWSVKWQVMTPSSFENDETGEIDLDKESEDLFYGDIVPFRLRKGQKDDFVLAVGKKFLTVLDSTGKVHQVLQLPYAPSAPIFVSDLNGDGILDIVVPTHHGYFGFITKTHTGTNLLTVLVMLVVALCGILYISDSITLEDPLYKKLVKID